MSSDEDEEEAWGCDELDDDGFGDEEEDGLERAEAEQQHLGVHADGREGAVVIHIDVSSIVLCVGWIERFKIKLWGGVFRDHTPTPTSTHHTPTGRQLLRHLRADPPARPGGQARGRVPIQPGRVRRSQLRGKGAGRKEGGRDWGGGPAGDEVVSGPPGGGDEGGRCVVLDWDVGGVVYTRVRLMRVYDP